MKRLLVTSLLLTICIAVYSQCFEDRHNSTLENAWVSCTPNLSPDGNDLTNRHWVMYDLGENYQLHDLTIWNYNHIDDLGQGVRELRISISDNGQDFTEAATVTIPMADGSSTYEGYEAFDFAGTNSRYILFTALANYGASCTGFAEMRVMLNPSSSVPVELVSFEVRKQESDAIIDWASATELNVDYYELQRSFDNQEWESIYEKDITINSYATKRYRHVDLGVSHYLDATEYVFYRLKMVDNDGTYAYSEIRSIRFDELEPLQELHLSPNPISETTTLNVDYLSEYENTDLLRITDVSGTIVYEQKLASQVGYNRFLLDLSPLLSKGIYVVQVGEKLNSKLVIQ